MADTHGPALTAAQISALAPGLPESMVKQLERQRANVSRVHGAAIAYSEKLLAQTRSIRDARLAEPKAQASAIVAWETAVDKLCATRGMSRSAATRELVAKRPDLHRAMLDAHNQQARTA